MSCLSDNALQVLQERYLLKDRNGRSAETPKEMFRRVAGAVAAAERQWSGEQQMKRWEAAFYKVMSCLAFLPNSPALMNAGTNLGQLSACFVLPIEDSLDAIFTTLKQAALIQQSGGGTGFNFSRLRPKGDPVYTAGGDASGPVSFMKIFSAATEYVKQGGKRRGANMGILHIDHPDIEEFISAKADERVLKNFNISVGISDAFMEAVDKNKPWNLVHPASRKIVKTVKARQLWDEIIRNAWLSGEPGLIFLDTINTRNPLIKLGRIEATNPCGEVPLLPYEACNLGSVNLSGLVKNEAGRAVVDWPALERVVPVAVRFLDNIIEVNRYPTPEIREITQKNRKIGLGVMGWAEMLVKLRIPYDSEDAVGLAFQIMKFIQEKSKDASAGLAAERGCFKNWEKSIYYPGEPLRNATRTSIAPTGTISIIAGTSSSIEPLFALAYERKYVLNDNTLTTVNNLFLDYLYERHLPVNDILEQVFASGSTAHIKTLPSPVRAIFKTALEISPEWHLKHQIAFQQSTDNAVSKTVNLPASATPEDVGSIYKMAWKQKAKGITVFRNDLGRKQVLHKGISGGHKDCKVCIE